MAPACPRPRPWAERPGGGPPLLPLFFFLGKGGGFVTKPAVCAADCRTRSPCLRSLPAPRTVIEPATADFLLIFQASVATVMFTLKTTAQPRSVPAGCQHCHWRAMLLCGWRDRRTGRLVCRRLGRRWVRMWSWSSPERSEKPDGVKITELEANSALSGHRGMLQLACLRSWGGFRTGPPSRHKPI